MKRSPIVLAIGVIFAASIGTAAVGATPISPTKAATVPVIPSCQVGYSYPYDSTMHYIYINMQTHYQFGYTSSGDPVHRVYWDYAFSNYANGSPADSMRQISIRVDVDGKESVYRMDSSDGYDAPDGYRSWYTNEPFSAWFGDYRTLAVRQYVVGTVPPLRSNGDIVANGIVRPSNRPPSWGNNNPNQYQCSQHTTSPY